MKKKKKTTVIIISVCVVVFSIVMIALFAGGGNSGPGTEETTAHSAEATESESIEIEIPVSESPGSGSETSGLTAESDFDIPDGADVITISEDSSVPEETYTHSGVKAEPNAEAQTASTYKVETTKETVPETKPIETKYSCGTAGHKCDSPETHAYVCNLELEGCPYCGSHTCLSFYGVDQWGNGGFFPELCPEYNTSKDAGKYCRVCGRKQGDGSNGTCVQFVSACTCPGCGEWVEAWTCHNHG